MFVQESQSFHNVSKKGQKSAHFGSNLGGCTNICSHAHEKNSSFKKFSETKFFSYILAHTVKENAFGGRPSD